MAEETEVQKKAKAKQKADKDSKVTALKKDANNTEDFAKKMATKIPQSGGMTVADFKNKWIPGFEQGYVQYTPDSTDTPYDMPYSNRPKVKILQEGTDNQSSSSMPKKT